MRLSIFKILIGIAILALSTLMCTFSPAQSLPDATQVAADVEKTIVSAKGTMEAEFNQAMQITAESAQPGEVNQNPQSAGKNLTGSIRGELSYPSEMIPPLRIVAFSTDGNWYYVDVQNTNMYEISELPVGTYTVVAYLQDSKEANLRGGYSQAVPCGLSVECADHSLIAVQVEAGKATEGIDPWDWYAPEGSFPSDPSRP